MSYLSELAEGAKSRCGKHIVAQLFNAKLWVPGEFTLIGNLHGDEVFLAGENVL